MAAVDPASPVGGGAVGEEDRGHRWLGDVGVGGARGLVDGGAEAGCGGDGRRPAVGSSGTVTTSSNQATAPRICSWMIQHGVAVATCRLCHVAIGPSGLCGASAAPAASVNAAMAAISV